MGAAMLSAARPQSELSAAGDDASRFGLFWGDLHNHNAVGYAQGSLERSIDFQVAIRRQERDPLVRALFDRAALLRIGG